MRSVSSPSCAGKLKATLERHTGPVFALRWNKRGDLLLTSSADESTVVWDVATSSVKQQFSFHGGEGRAGRGRVQGRGCGAAGAAKSEAPASCLPPCFRLDYSLASPNPPPCSLRPGRRLAQRHLLCHLLLRQQHPPLQAGQRAADEDLAGPHQRGEGQRGDGSGSSA
jgi:hypothetical protein